ncbi:lanthionine synthetase LanC family protein [Streptoalloteichus hindustanus]|uniref:Lanthionine synthetase C-like protein n=1 Tax=Streptoalloteichus hindustanus TaxID=2017 RepID=A0A1M5JTW0_STRHI|nr:lanthionine synthetase LanC family protein [Streptoalloteichus hindustanus]SHG43845.1 Lanthionine synthetase C-like protein [Streptoalloteichus hindustanus]
MTTRLEPGTPSAALDLAGWALATWAERGRRSTDPGPAVLAFLLGPRHSAVAPALRRWLTELEEPEPLAGLHDGGLAGQLGGLRLLSPLYPRLSRVAEAVSVALTRAAHRGHWSAGPVGFPSYDVVSGPAGVLLAHCVHGPRDGELTPFAAALAARCDQPDLAGLRCTAYQEHEALAWNQGLVNAGLAHGAAGVAVALAAAVHADPADDHVAAALRRVGRWLAGEAFRDDRGVYTWSSAGREGAATPTQAGPRQAWCYGCPGGAWALREASVALTLRGTSGVAAELGQVALVAMRSLAQNFDEDFHLVGEAAADRLAVCHGAAGVLAIADAFAHWTGMPDAVALRDRLRSHLLLHLDEVAGLAMSDMSLLGGAAGVLAVLLTIDGGNRAWLPLLALR